MTDWLAFALVVASLWALAEDYRTAGWLLNLAACAAWALVGLRLGAEALVAQQIVLACIGVRGLQCARRR